MLIHEHKDNHEKKQSLSADTSRPLAVIFRIIGNENPPRDNIGQRLRVLEYILKEEPTFDSVEKWYILNRLQNIQYRRAVCELLDRYNAKYITIPLDRNSVISAPDYATKVCAAVGINHARNIAIEHGRWLANYVVVLDGDCMFDKEGWDAVAERMVDNTHQYISIPHVRTSIDRITVTGKQAEPMVAVRSDAVFRFDESIPFGKGDKLKFLYQLGHDQTPGSGHCGVEGDMTVLTGYVLHLATGNEQIEESTKVRIEARDESMVKLMSRIEDESPIRYGGHNEYYKTIESACDFDYSGQYSAIAFDAPDNAHIVEVGSWVGKSVCYLATEFKGYGKRVRIDCVDVWGGEVNDQFIMEQTALLGGDEAVYQLFKNNIKDAHVDHLITPIRKRSVEAAKLYEDSSLDVVWIDASHCRDDVLDDLRAWYPKVKVGGLIAGHDFVLTHPYSREGVVSAVLEFFKLMPLEIMISGRTWKSIKYDNNWPTFRQRRWV